MSLSIENFRALVTNKADLENRRVTVGDQQDGGQRITAPNSLWGRVVDWWKGTDIGQARAHENTTARESFYNALVKAEGQAFADRIVEEALGYDSGTFTAKTTSLQASKIQQVFDTADRLRGETLTQNNRVAREFIDSTDFADMAALIGEDLGHPGIDTEDPELGTCFRHAVRFNPDYGRKEFANQDLGKMAREAVELYCEQKKARFEEQYPSLSKLENGHSHDSATFFRKVRGDLEKPPLSDLTVNGEKTPGAKWIKDATRALENCAFDLGRMHFEPEEAMRLQDRIFERRSDVSDLLESDAIKQTFDGFARDAACKTIASKANDAISSAIGSLFKEEGYSDRALDQYGRPNLAEKVQDEVKRALDEAAREPDFDMNNSDRQDKIIGSVIASLIEPLSGVSGRMQKAVFDALKEGMKAGFAEAANSDLPENLVQARNKALELGKALTEELENHYRKLTAKFEFLDEYMHSDPLSQKNVAYHELQLKQATHLLLADVREKLDKLRDEEQAKQPPDPGRVAKLQGHIDIIDIKLALARMRVVEAEAKWHNADPRRSDVSPKGEKDKAHPLNQARSDEIHFLHGALKEAKVLLPGSVWWPCTEGVIRGQFKKMHVKALDTMQDWHVIDRKMVVSREGVTRTYRSVITPGSRLGNIVGDRYDDRGGVSAGNKTEAEHARNLQISELYRIDRNEKGDEVPVKVSQTIRHGVLDPWEIKDPQERMRASERGASEVIDTAVISNAGFKDRLLQKSLLNNPDDPRPPSKLVHVNLNLTTADSSMRSLKAEFAEKDFTEHQFAAFEAQNGMRAMTIRDDENEDRQVNLEVDTITFSFGVNKFAMGEGLGMLFSEDTIWPPEIVEHNRVNLTKLVGDLTVRTAPGGYIGGLVDRLNQRRTVVGPQSDEGKALTRLIGQIQRETDEARDIFNRGEYKRGIDDAYKMNRTLHRLVNLGEEALQKLGDNDTLMTVSQGCKSNKDRGGMQDVEHKSQVIIEDMGGRVQRGQEFSEQDQTIYNTVLTSSGQAEVQRLNTGLPGSKNAKELADRINDPDALMYARGFASFTKA
jgi:hypothetical protein